MNRWLVDLEGEAVAEEGTGTSYAFLKVLRTVGEAVAPPARESDRPVDELPKDRGSEDVWRVSFGLETEGRR